MCLIIAGAMLYSPWTFQCEQVAMAVSRVTKAGCGLTLSSEANCPELIFDLIAFES